MCPSQVNYQAMESAGRRGVRSLQETEPLLNCRREEEGQNAIPRPASLAHAEFSRCHQIICLA